MDKRSANPGINGAPPIPDDDKDHDTICKPESREDKVYKGVKHLVQACINNIFICYGHKNVQWRDRLVSRLEKHNPDYRFEVWYDEIGIEVGHDWQRSIEAALEAANVAIVLISPDFLASRYIQSNELPAMLERREALELQVLPVVVEACDWQGQDWLRRIQVYQGGRQNSKEVSLLTVVASNTIELITPRLCESAFNFGTVDDKVMEHRVGYNLKVDSDVELQHTEINQVLLQF